MRVRFLTFKYAVVPLFLLLGFTACTHSSKNADTAGTLPARTPGSPTPSYDFNAMIDSNPSFTIRGATLFDGEKIWSNSVVVVKDGFIAQVCEPTSAGCPVAAPTDLDGRGKFLMPSLIDSEGHFTLANEMMRDLLEHSPPSCTVKNGVKYGVPSKSALVNEYSSKDLFTEIDTHGTVESNLGKPRVQGGKFEIPQSANYEKHMRFGVTTVFDMHTNPWPASYMRRSNGKWGPARNEEQRELKKQFLVYADLFYPSMWAMPHNLQFHYFGVDPVYNLEPEGPWTTHDIERWVQRRKREGAFHIKIFFQPKSPNSKTYSEFTPKTMKAIVDSSHRAGLKVVSHVSREKLIAPALEAGVDGFMHIPSNNKTLFEPASLALMKSKLGFDVSTLLGSSSECDNPYSIVQMFKNELEGPEVLPYTNGLDDIRLASCYPPSLTKDYEMIMKNVASMADAGIPLLVGVDSGDEIAPLVEGLGLHAEIAALKFALQNHSVNHKTNEAATLFVLKAATSNAARAFEMTLEGGRRPKADPRGFVKKGYRADLLLLKRSPFDDIRNTLKIQEVWKAGYRTNRQAVRPDCVDGTCEARKIVRAATEAACKP